MNKREVGSRYEQMAAHYLEEHGMSIITMNYQRKIGEIDLIARDGLYIVFVEVKYRNYRNAGGAMYAIPQSKRNKVIKTAKFFCMENRIPFDAPLRFDAVLIDGENITHIPNAWQCGR